MTFIMPKQLLYC